MIFYILLEIFNILKVIIVCVIAYDYIGVFYNILQKAKSFVIVKWNLISLFGPFINFIC